MHHLITVAAHSPHTPHKPIVHNPIPQHGMTYAQQAAFVAAMMQPA